MIRLWIHRQSSAGNPGIHKSILHGLKYNNRLLESHIQDLTEDIERVTLGNHASSLNWLYGHIVAKRAHLLKAFWGCDIFWKKDYDMYLNYDKALNSESSGPTIEQLRKDHRVLSKAIAQKCKQDIDVEKAQELIEYLLNEAYYIGQIATTDNILSHVEVYW